MTGKLFQKEKSHFIVFYFSNLWRNAFRQSMMHMEQLDRNIVLSVFSQNDQFQDRRAQRQKHLQIKTITQQVIKAVDDINLTQIYKLECLVKKQTLFYLVIR